VRVASLRRCFDDGDLLVVEVLDYCVLPCFCSEVLDYSVLPFFFTTVTFVEVLDYSVVPCYTRYE